MTEHWLLAQTMSSSCLPMQAFIGQQQLRKMLMTETCMLWEKK